MRRWSRNLVPLIAATALLFTQFVVAGQACVMPSSMPWMAFSGDAMPDCSEMNRNACLAQCLQPAQAVDTVAAPSLAPPSIQSILVAWNEPASIAALPASPLVVRETGPPIHILICRLLD